jgi:hypothetical protein
MQAIEAATVTYINADNQVVTEISPQSACGTIAQLDRAEKVTGSGSRKRA